MFYPFTNVLVLSYLHTPEPSFSSGTGTNRLYPSSNTIQYSLSRKIATSLDLLSNVFPIAKSKSSLRTSLSIRPSIPLVTTFFLFFTVTMSFKVEKYLTSKSSSMNVLKATFVASPSSSLSWTT